MRLIFRLMLWLLAAGAAAALGGLGLGYYLATRSIPDYAAAWSAQGLEAPVEIVRDAQAVPHIFARTDADAFFALGWAHAQDRLWQMEVARRTAEGRLAELFGPRAAPVDLSMRALELARRARDALAFQSAETRALLDAYAAGVNAQVRAVNARALGRGAPELFLFGEDGLAPWTAADSLALIKLMALRLTSAARTEARRARLLALLSPEQIADLDPEQPDKGALAAPAFDGAPDGLPAPADRAEAAPPAPSPFSPFPEAEGGGASNIWAVSGARAASGAPLLASDPHLWLSAPSVWMLARLSSPDFNAIGGSIPGIPAILIGRNDAFGWGLATTQIDDQDIYLEQIDPESPGRYRTPSGWAEFEVREETLQVAGRAPARLRFLSTRHGPVMPAGGELDFGAVTPSGHVAALAWTGLAVEDRSMDALLALMRARSVEEGDAATRLHLAPAQNVAMADAQGVGMSVAGAIPLRRADSRTQGRIPSLGWRAENDWDGFMPPDAAPRALRPPSGAVANANNRVTNGPFPQHLSFDWAEPYRYRRIARRLADREFHSRESFMEMQSDAVSEMARSVLPLIARDLWWGPPPETDAAGQRRAAALDLLRQWNGEMSMHDPEPLIFSEWMRMLTRRLAEDELGAAFPLIEGPRPLFVERVFHDVDGASRWCDVVKTPERERCADIARLALDDALAALTARHGPRVEGWRWGAEHVATHVHTPLGLQRWLGLLVNVTHESPGDAHTILMGATPGRGPEPHANVHAAGLRMVLDFADLDRSVFVIATGQSGHPLSRHYDDLGRLWRRGDYAPMSLNPEDARAGARGITRLEPAG